MKLKKYLYEYRDTEGFGSGESKAFFISPKGELISSGGSHINIITDHPEKFGITIEHIRDIYAKHNERMGIEGLAREELIVDLIKQGWIHIRRRPNRYWAVMIGKMTPKIKKYLYDFAIHIVKGVQGVIELNPEARVLINSVSDSYHKDTSLDLIADHSLEENVKLPDLKICHINELANLI